MKKNAMRIKIMLFTAVLILSLITFYIASIPFAAGEIINGSIQKTGRVVMVVIDQLSWDDVSGNNLPVTRKIISSGAVGLMTTNPGAGGLRTPENTYATIGAGTKILGGDSGGDGFNVWEEYENGKAEISYFRRTGRKADGQVVNVGIAQIETANRNLNYNYVPGSIGTVLHRYGVKTGVIGNSDVFGLQERDKFRRYAVNIAMDRNGQVDYGEVGSSCLTPDEAFLGGFRSDYSFLLKKFREIKDYAGFLVIDTGDISRLESQGTLASAAVLQNQKKNTLARIDVFLGELLQEVDLSKDLLMIVVPGPSYQSMNNGDFLTPFFMAGKGVKQGIVYSGTTRRDGLISNTDIAATVVDFFGFPPVVKGTRDKKDIILGGQVIAGNPSVHPVDEVSVLSKKTMFMHNTRYPFVKTYINLCLIILTVSVAAIKLDIKAGGVIKPILLAVTFIPAVYLLADLMSHFSQGIVGLLMSLITLAMVLFSIYLSKTLRFSPFLISSGLTTALLIFDIFSGGNLSKTSPLSYDATAGARFYGIGNEYMGVLIGAAITFITLSLEKFRSGISLAAKIAVTLISLIVVYTISAPNLGTNAGGAIASIAGLGTAGIILYGRKFSLKTLAPIAVVTVSVLTMFVIFDFTRSVETQSHMGRTLGLIQQNGVSEILSIVSRKTEINLKLIKYTTWSWYFFLSLGVIVFRHRLFPCEIEQWEEQNPWLNRMLPGIVAGCLAALIFNDSGVVASATMISFGIPPILWSLIQTKERTVQQ